MQNKRRRDLFCTLSLNEVGDLRNRADLPHYHFYEDPCGSVDRILYKHPI